MFASLQNLYVEVLTPHVMVFEDGPFGRFSWGHEGGVPVLESLPLSEEKEALRAPSLYQVRTQRGVAICEPGREPSQETESAGSLVWKLQSSEKINLC